MTFLAVITAAPVHAAVIQVAAGGDLQAALNAAQPGDEVVLPAGATFTGTFILPRKTGVVTLRSAGTLPERRIGPSDAALLATLRSGSSQSALYGENTANWRITERVDLTAGVRNLLDTQYTLVDGFPEEGRSAFATLRLRL